MAAEAKAPRLDRSAALDGHAQHAVLVEAVAEHDLQGPQDLLDGRATRRRVGRDALGQLLG